MKENATPMTMRDTEYKKLVEPYKDEAFKASLLAETEKLLQLCGCTSAKTSIETNDYSKWMTKESK